MVYLDDLDLPMLDLAEPGFVEDPHSRYAAALEKSWMARFMGGTLVLNQQSMKDILADTENWGEPFDDFVTRWGAEDTVWGKFQLDIPIALGGEKHRRLRNLIAPAFTPRQANQHRPFMRARFNELCDRYAGRDSFDFTRLAAHYPISIMCQLLGVPTADIDRIEEWLATLGEGIRQDSSLLPKLNAATEGLIAYIRPVIAERRAGKHVDDLLQTLIHASDQEDRLTDDELHHFAVSLLAGGYDTTKNQLAHTVEMMIEFPEAYAKLAADPEGRTKSFIEEALRLRSMFGATARVARRETTYRGVTFPAGTMLSLPLTFAGQDPAFNANARTFDIDRGTSAHIAFGIGPHFCPGMFLARALLEEALPIIVRRFPHPRLAGKPVYTGPLGAWQLESLPISWSPALEAA